MNQRWFTKHFADGQRCPFCSTCLCRVTA